MGEGLFEKLHNTRQGLLESMIYDASGKYEVSSSPFDREPSATHVMVSNGECKLQPILLWQKGTAIVI